MTTTLDTIDDLTAELIAAAKNFQEGEEGTPDTVYAQLSQNNGWRAAFATDHRYDCEMTRWSTGKDVADLYAAILANDQDVIGDYAGDIVTGWDDEWTD